MIGGLGTVLGPFFFYAILRKKWVILICSIKKMYNFASVKPNEQTLTQ
jgi:hypothetical protein